MTNEQLEMIIKIVKNSPLYEEHVKEQLLKALNRSKDDWK